MKKLFHNKKVTSGVVIFLMVLALGIAKNTGKPAAASSIGYVNVNVVNVRTGPSTNYARVSVNGKEAYLTLNQQVEIYSSSGSWYKIKSTFNNKAIEGYCYAPYITVVAPILTPTPVPEIKYNAYVNVSVVNVRTGPSTNYAQVKVDGKALSFKLNQKVEVISKSGSWYYLRAIYNGKEVYGYSYAPYYTMTGSIQPAPTAKPASNPTSAPNTVNAYLGTVIDDTANGLNVRIGPSTSYSKVVIDGKTMTLKYGTQITILAQTGNWYYMRTNANGYDFTGYVSAKYVIKGNAVKVTPTPAVKATATPVPKATSTPTPKPSVTNQPATPTPVPGVGTITAYIGTSTDATANGLNVRIGPGTTYSKVTVNGTPVTLKLGAQVTIFSQTGKWYYIRATVNGHDITGYCSGTYIKKGNAIQVTPTPVPAKNPYNAYVSVSSVNVRTGPSTSYDRVVVNGSQAYLVRNQELEVISTSGEWSYIRATYNKQEIYGYLFASYVTKKAVTPTATPKPTATPTATPKPTATPTATPVPATATPTATPVPATSTPTATPKPTSTPTATPVPTVTPVTISAIIGTVIDDTENGLNVRTGPGTSYSKIVIDGKTMTLHYGVQITIFSQTGNWYFMRAIANGYDFTGYVSAKYVKTGNTVKVTPTPTATPVPTATPKPTATPTVTPVPATATPTPDPNVTVTPTSTPQPFEPVNAVANTTVNVRTGPDTMYSRVVVNGVEAVLSKGDSLVILGVSGDWYKVKTRFKNVEIEGYLFAEYVTPEKAINVPSNPTATPVPTKAPTATPTSVPENPVNPDGTPNEFFRHKAFVCTKSINFRESPSSSTGKILGTLPYGQELTILCQVYDGSQSWYGVETVFNGKLTKGYVYSVYVCFKSTPSAEAVVRVQTSNLHVSDSSKSDTVKNASGSPLNIPSGSLVYLVSQMADDPYWFKATYNDGVRDYSGFILWSDIIMVSPTPVPTAPPTPSVSPTPIPTVTPKPTLTPVITNTPTPTVTNTPSPTPTPYLGNANISSVSTVLSVKTAAGEGGMLVKDDAGNAVYLKNTDEVKIVTRTVINDTEWFEVEFIFEGVEYAGYINSCFVTTPETEVDFETKLEQQGFPESYKVKLRALHEKYPSWQFVANHVGLDWEKSLNSENVVGTNLLPNSKSIEWKSLEKGAYNWKTDSFVIYDGTYWVTASKEALAYYMDPRNWLDATRIFQFELLSYQSDYQTLDGIKKILNNTLLGGHSFNYVDSTGATATMTYDEVFIAAAEYSGVSPYHMASRVKQEVIKGTGALSDSVTGTVPGYEGLYNFFNIGAYNSTAPNGAIINGLKYAKYGTTNEEYNRMALIPWTDPYRSILGGGYFLGRNYIVGRGQNTIYLQKFNMTSTATYSHQYMGNVEAPYSESAKVVQAYGQDAYTLPIVFSIPVYENMPETPCPAPKKAYNPNNWLSTLTVTDRDGNTLPLSPTFDISKSQEYAVILDADMDLVKLNGTAVSTKAKVAGAGAYSLEFGLNRLILYVTAENGDVREYIVNVVREAAE